MSTDAVEAAGGIRTERLTKWGIVLHLVEMFPGYELIEEPGQAIRLERYGDQIPLYRLTLRQLQEWLLDEWESEELAPVLPPGLT
jgi:hypothetical protein